MSLSRIAKPFRRRLPAVLTASDWRWIARAPSYRAPRAKDVLDPPEFVPPGLPRMSAEERRLLDAVIAEPDADEPRLTYAEWCDRQGDGRGEFIRKQIEEYRRTRSVGDGVEPHPVAYAPGSPGRGIHDFTPWSARDFVFRRGFVEGLSLSGRAFISLGESLFRMTPLREVRLVAVQCYMDELARSPHLAKVERLDLAGNQVGASGVKELARSSFCDRLRGLNLSQNSLGAAGVRALLQAPWRGRLRELSLAGNGLNAEVVAELVADESMAGLVELDLSANAPTALPGDWPRLERLVLAGNPLNPAALDSVLRIGSLRSLNLMHCQLGPGVAEAMAGASLRLESLELGFNDIGDAGLGSAIANVRRLGLRGNRIGPAGAAALSAAEVGEVVELDLMTNQVGDAGILAIVAGDGFASLERLNVSNNGITDTGVKRLVASGAMGGLRSLSLAWNPLGNAGVKALASCPDLAGLRELDLTGAGFGLAGAKALVESRYLRLRRLVLGENHQLPEDARRMLGERFGRTMGEDASSMCC